MRHMPKVVDVSKLQRVLEGGRKLFQKLVAVFYTQLKVNLVFRWLEIALLLQGLQAFN